MDQLAGDAIRGRANAGNCLECVGLDERRELGHLRCILTLLVFSEAEEVGAVRGAEPVEEEVVLSGKGPFQSFLPPIL